MMGKLYQKNFICFIVISLLSIILYIRPCEGNFSDLYPVSDPTEYPWIMNVLVESSFTDIEGNPVPTTCSGVLIDPKHVLTAGHCLYSTTVTDKQNNVHIINDKADTVNITPGFSISSPYGHYSSCRRCRLIVRPDLFFVHCFLKGQTAQTFFDAA
jgi:hypothetical protein